MVNLSSLKNTVDQIGLAFYMKFLETNKTIYTVDECHALIRNSIVALPRAIASYLKLLVSMQLLKKNGEFIVTELFLTKGKLVYEKNLEVLQPKPKTEKTRTDESGLLKY